MAHGAFEAKRAAGGQTARERRAGGGPASFKCKRNGVYVWFWVPFESFGVPDGKQMELRGYRELDGTQMERRFGDL